MLRISVTALALLFEVIGSAQMRHPVLVELFTSEGCSSCPPADALLEELDKSQPVPGTEILVLSEHVDYWNSIGWRDPYSSPLFSKRQRTYGDRFRLDSVYTPQIVVNGNAEVLGSDKERAIEAVQQALRAESVEIHLNRSPAGLELRVEKLPPSFKTGEAEVFLAVADGEDTSSVHGGENNGRRLHHVAVLRSLTAVGGVSARAGLTKELPVAKYPEGSRLIALVQASGQGRILGSTMLRK